MQSKAHLQKQSVDRFKHGCVPGGLLLFRDIFHFRGEKEKKRKEKTKDKTRQDKTRKEKKRKEKKRKEKKRKEKKRKKKTFQADIIN